MLFELVRTVGAHLVLARFVKEGALDVFAFRFHVLMTLLVHHRPAAGTLILSHSDAIDEVVALRAVEGERSEIKLN